MSDCKSFEKHRKIQLAKLDEELTLMKTHLWGFLSSISTDTRFARIGAGDNGVTVESSDLKRYIEFSCLLFVTRVDIQRSLFEMLTEMGVRVKAGVGETSSIEINCSEVISAK